MASAEWARGASADGGTNHDNMVGEESLHDSGFVHGPGFVGTPCPPLPLFLTSNPGHNRILQPSQWKSRSQSSQERRTSEETSGAEI